MNVFLKNASWSAIKINMPLPVGVQIDWSPVYCGAFGYCRWVMDWLAAILKHFGFQKRLDAEGGEVRGISLAFSDVELILRLNPIQTHILKAAVYMQILL